MTRLDTKFLLPVSLLVFIAQTAANQQFPTAIRKLSPDSGEKLLSEHLAFAPLRALIPGEAGSAALEVLESEPVSFADGSLQVRSYRPAFARHYYVSEENMLRRAAAALALLERRSACPAGMSTCDSIGSRNKCCQQGTVCTRVEDSTVAGVACCPQGQSCGGRVGNCPSDAISCPAQLGGGCCIPGYVCQGAGCVPKASATPETSTATVIQTNTRAPTHETVTATRTTIIEGNPSTVIVTEVITRTAPGEGTTLTTTEFVTASNEGTVTGNPPWRPTGTSAEETDSQITDTQSGCPTGFYGCLARHGGGCCQTDRDCNTHSCPPVESTTIISDGKTLVVPATDVPSQATSTCAGGWFLCGDDAGPVAGCCPSGYECGTASCFTAQATQTESVQKQQPKKSHASAGVQVSLTGFGSALLLHVGYMMIY